MGQMSSSNVGQVLPASAFSYAVSLRVRHPTLDLSVLADKLRLEPAHCWAAGEPRRSQTGSPLGGNHRDSYWSAPLPAQMTGPSSMPLELFFSQQLLQLSRHRDFLNKLQSDGGGDLAADRACPDGECGAHDQQCERAQARRSEYRSGVSVRGGLRGAPSPGRVAGGAQPGPHSRGRPVRAA